MSGIVMGMFVIVIIRPCGRCRQLLSEHGGKQLLVETPEGIQTMAEVLPQAFGPDDLV